LAIGTNPVYLTSQLTSVRKDGVTFYGAFMSYIGDSFSVFDLIITNTPVTLANSVTSNIATEKLINIGNVD
jgi:hypothetical protein